MSLHERVKTRVRVDCELSEEFEIVDGMHKGSVQSPFPFAVVTEFARDGALYMLLYGDDLILIRETIKGLGNEFLEWKEAFESMGLKVNFVMTMAMVSGSITKDGLSKC